MEKEKRERRVTPIGEAKWAHLQTPKQTIIDGKPKGDPKYQIDVVFAPTDPQWVAWAKDLTDAIKALPAQIDKKTGDTVKKQSPIKRELDRNDEPTGRHYITLKTSDKFKPTIFDKYGKKMEEDVKIGNGSKVQAAYMENVYTAFGGGINLYLNAVQVLELVEYQSQSAKTYGFAVEDAPEIPEEITDSEPF